MYEIAAVNTSPFRLFLSRKTNIWFTMFDGNWSNPDIWISNALDKKVITAPQLGDTVYINHNITMDSNIQVNNMYISGNLKGNSISAFTITINGDLQVSGSGTIDLSLQFNNLILNGYNNVIPFANFNGGSFSTVTFNGRFDQNLLNIPYHNLTTQNGKKYQVSDITVGGNFNQQSDYECNTYNLTINGSSTIGTVGSYIFSKNSSVGNILFIGAVDFEGGTDLSTGNPNVEFRGGITIHTFNFTTGAGLFTFSTNNQTINPSAYLGGSWNADILVAGPITLTWSGNPTISVNGIINGNSSGSIFNNNGTLYLGNSTTPMNTGVFNYQNSSTSTLGYVFNGSFALPYTSYTNLFIGGTTGTKSLSGATVINKSLTIGTPSSSGSKLDCAGYNLDVKGEFVCYCVFIASVFSNIVFEGLATFSNGGNSAEGVDLRNGNPNVEFRNGLTAHAYFAYTGTGIFTFTTNNQTINFSILNSGSLDCNWLISGPITVQFINGNVNNPAFKGTINGDNAASIFDVRGTLNYQNSNAPMIIGHVYCNQGTNTFLYNSSGNQNIQAPSDPSSPGYYNLTLGGSGSKTLVGDVSVKNVYTLTTPATLNLNGHLLTNP